MDKLNQMMSYGIYWMRAKIVAISNKMKEKALPFFQKFGAVCEIMLIFGKCPKFNFSTS